MAALRRWWARLVATVRPDTREADLAREITAHLDLLQDGFIRQGLRPDQARVAARRAMGGVELTKELHRDARAFRWLSGATQDARYAIRSLRGAPQFALTTLLTLALGIGATTAVYSVVRAVLVAPLPWDVEQRFGRLIVHLPPVDAPDRQSDWRLITATQAEAEDVALGSRSVDYLGVLVLGLRSVRGIDDAARLEVARVSSSAFQTIGIRAFLGRVLEPSDDLPGALPVVVVSHDLWRRHFGSDPEIVGRMITLESGLGRRTASPATVIGVMPPSFEFPSVNTQMWLPLPVPAAGATARPTQGVLVARLAAGSTPAAAAAELGPRLRALRRDPPTARYEFRGEREYTVRDVSSVLAAVLGAVGLLLLIAVVNVATLQLARNATREREFAIRSALGASRGRLVRQALTEGLMLAGGGGAVGLILATACVRVVQANAGLPFRTDLQTPLTFPRLHEVGLDIRVLGAALVLTAGTGLVCGLISGFVHRQRRPHTGLLSSLVIGQVAAGLMLLAGSGVLVNSVIRLMRVEPGYSSERVLTFQVTAPIEQLPDTQLVSFAEQLTERLRTIRGVDVTAYGNQLPMVGLRDTAGGVWRTADPNRPPAPYGPDGRFVSRDYLRALGIRVIAGRGLDQRDGEGRPRVLLVNRALGRSLFADESPIGQPVFIGKHTTPWHIVGVVDDVRQFELRLAPEPQFFVDIRQAAGIGPLFPVGPYFVARTTGDPLSVLSEVRQVVKALAPDAALFHVAPMDAIVAATLERPRSYALVFVLFAALGLALAAVGVYGLLSYAVAQRTKEIGIRLAIGATPAHVKRSIMWQGLLLCGGGVACGLAGAAGLAGYLQSLLFEVGPLDPVTLAAASLLLIAVGALAAYLPAREATSIDPLTALRCD